MDKSGAANLNKREEKGFTLVEMVVAIMLGILATILLDRMLFYQEMAEKTAVEMTVMNMRTGLRYQVAAFLVHNQESDIAGLAGENPVKWLDRSPSNYLGELRKPRWDDIPPGNWYFDISTRELCYRVNRNRNFVPGQSGKQTLCLRATALSGKGAGGTVALVQGVRITLVEPYRWF